MVHNGSHKIGLGLIGLTDSDAAVGKFYWLNWN